MAVQLVDLKRPYGEKVRKASVRKQKSRDDSGHLRVLYRLDVDSDDFDIQFGKAFSLSVAKARKEHRKAADERARPK